MVRYPFIATLHGDPVLNQNGDPISEGADTLFMADFQLGTGGQRVNYAGSFVDVHYKLFVAMNAIIEFKVGAEVTCNGSKGTIVSMVPDAKNMVLWVQ